MGDIRGAARQVSHTERRASRVSVERLFDEVVAEDVLPKVLHRYGIVPAVVGTEDLTGPWDTPGSRRVVRTADGRALREEVTHWRRPGHFAYRVSGFAGAMGLLVRHATGQWWFWGDDDRSEFVWTYTFVARNRCARWLLVPFVRLMWAGYMRGCADRCVELAEGSRTGNRLASTEFNYLRRRCDKRHNYLQSDMRATQNLPELHVCKPPTSSR